MQLALTFIILIITIVLFMSSRIRADLVALLAVLSMVITGNLDPIEALSGFSNHIVFMVAGLFIVGSGLLPTGLAQMAGAMWLRWSGKSETKLFSFCFLL